MASRSLNKVMLIGNLGADPEVRMTPSGVQVATISIATTSSWKDQSGAAQEKTEWHRVILWRGLADIVQKYLKKGNSVYIEGKLQSRSWEDNNGQKRYVTEVIADQLIMLGSASGGGGGSVPPPSDSDFSNPAPTANNISKSPGDSMSKNKPEPPMTDNNDDDLPF